ncbi:MAG: Rne/Rng family ribonuclease [Paracoccaceae bacterium]|nr:Rne/Rng family ribonuclease [Paracoccaceae bacterium]
MAKKMLIDATHTEETRVVVVDGNRVDEFDFETVNKRQLAGNIYLAKVTRVEPSLQAAFVDYGGNRHGFLAFSEIHPDYYQIPVADRQALLAEERAYAEEQEAEDTSRPRRKSRSKPKAKAETATDGDARVSSDHIPGMNVVDHSDDDDEDNSADGPDTNEAAENGEKLAQDDTNGDKPYVAADHASETDDDIESVADEDVAEEIRQPRKPRPRKYKIQEVVKVRQIMLVQVVKEERGNKGAALTTYLSLAGRYCVLMPNTARGGGISRKITNVADRKKLKEIANEIEVPEGAGLIIRTAGSQRTKTEIKRDYEYLLRLWEQIRDLTMKSIAPAPIYAEGDLIKRTIRDLYNKDIDEVLVEGPEGYRAAKDFMKMIMPSHAKNVKHYHEGLPLFARFQVESYLAAMFNPTVQLKSGGYIVIGITEALVAIDVNSGRSTKEGSIEDTALKTNLEAAEEVARQLRLRDLAGLIVIDFIDMEERRNNAAVEKRLKDKLKTDRARIQVGRISGFGLLEMSRQRLRPGMLEATTAPCHHCHGTGIIRSDDSLALSVLRQLEEEGTRNRSKEVLLRAPVAIVNFLMNQKREHVAQIEMRYGLSVRIEADPTMISPDFVIEKFKTATRIVPDAVSPVVSASGYSMADLDAEDDIDIPEEEDEAETAASEPTSATAEGDGEPTRKKKRRRRRRRKSGNGQTGEGQADDNTSASPAEDGSVAAAQTDDVALTAGADTTEADSSAKPKPKRTRSRSRKKPDEAETATVSETAPEVAPEAPAASAEEADKPAKPRRKRATTAKAKSSEPAESGEADEMPEPEAVVAAPAKKPRASRAKKKPADAATPLVEAAPAAVAAPAAEAPKPMPSPDPVAASAVALQPDPQLAEAVVETDKKPKRRGWWSIGR